MHPARQRIAELSREIADLAFMLAAAEVELAALPDLPARSLLYPAAPDPDGRLQVEEEPA